MEVPADSQTRILDAATELFCQKGYYGTSMDAIAKKAGTSKGNLYWHFKSKQEVFRRLQERLLTPLMLPLDEILRSDSPPREKLINLGNTCLDTAETHPQAVRLIWQIAAQPELQQMQSEEYSQWMTRFTEQLCPLFEAIGDMEPQNAATFYAITLDAFMGMIVLGGNIFDKKKMLDILTKRLIDFKGGPNGTE